MCFTFPSSFNCFNVVVASPFSNTALASEPKDKSATSNCFNFNFFKLFSTSRRIALSLKSNSDLGELQYFASDATSSQRSSVA